MKTVKKIFFDDVIGLVKNFFALTIIIGICFLPALYAWFNIYSNWDPYGNTGALKFAAVSLDKGYTDEEGEYHNQGDTIIENLHENTSVDWQFVENADEAINGVYSGEYYAAVIVDEEFTYNMYNVLSEEVDRPTLHFYENQKKNPVATKISDTVVQTLQNNINVAFTEVVVSEVFSSVSEVSDELQEKNTLGTALEKLRELSDDLTAYQNTITSIIENDAQLQASLAAAETDATNMQNQAQSAANAITKSAGVSSQSNTTIANYTSDVNSVLNIVNTKLTEMDELLEKAKLVDDSEVMAELLAEFLKNNETIQQYANLLPVQVGDENIEDILNQLKDDLEAIDEEIPEQIADTAADAVETNYLADKKIDEILDYVNKAQSILNTTQSHFNTLSTKVTNGLNSLTGMLNNTNKLLNNVGETFGNLVVMFSAIDNTIDCANTSLEKTNEAIVYVNGRLIDVINQVEKANSGEKLQVLINALSGDPEVYGKFFSTPVEVVTEAVYPVENYGSAVAPFYSTLAFWVGALILTAIIKIHPDKSKYPDASQRQLFFGRYVLYWILGQIQAIIIVLGDLFLLRVQCVHPILFLCAASVIATTFTILIYSIVATWGDAGKALAVVIVVIQIAGSSGTYPIELLPEFFKKVYIFFPFPYAINAIRECLCGMYELDYLKYLGCLCIFIAVSLVIGLLVRIPFEQINHYMEERMEDTEMM